MSAHAYLRVATRSAHDQVDALLSGYDLADRDDYIRFLGAQAAAFLPVEQALDQADAASLIPDWAERQRSGQLLDDLAELGIDPPAGVQAPSFSTPAEVLGGVYVLEGSRLGGSMLARSIGPGLPRNFLDGGSMRGGWKSLLALLEQNLPSIVERERAGKSAIMTFDCFSRAASVSVDSR